jgi:hypothetical protein
VQDKRIKVEEKEEENIERTERKRHNFRFSGNHNSLLRFETAN